MTFLTGAGETALPAHVQLRRYVSKLRWRGTFARWYHDALQRQDTIKILNAFGNEICAGSWVREVTTTLRPARGKDAVASTSIDAPVVMIAWGEHKKVRSPAFVMSCYFSGESIRINQLQGIAGFNVRGLAWAKKMVAACIMLAVKENLREVRLVKATSLPTYRNPTIYADSRSAYQTALERIRAKMCERYDATALDLDFQAQGKWWVWKNPNYRRSR